MTQIFRFAVPDDSDQILDFYSHYILNTTATFEIAVPARDEFRNRIESILATHPYIVCEREGAVTGYAYASRYSEREAYDFCTTVSVYLKPGFAGSGLGTRLYTRLLALLPLLGFRIAYAAITQPNPASIALHEKFNFSTLAVYKNCGYKHGKWLDVLWMEKVLADFPPGPEPVRTPDSLESAVINTVFRSGNTIIRKSGNG